MIISKARLRLKTFTLILPYSYARSSMFVSEFAGIIGQKAPNLATFRIIHLCTCDDISHEGLKDLIKDITTTISSSSINAFPKVLAGLSMRSRSEGFHVGCRSCHLERGLLILKITRVTISKYTRNSITITAHFEQYRTIFELWKPQCHSRAILSKLPKDVAERPVDLSTKVLKRKV
jgi:hypothetical protein